MNYFLFAYCIYGKYPYLCTIQLEKNIMTQSIDNRVITTTSNKTARTYTIYVRHNDGTTIKYRTTRMSKDEFQSCSWNTQNDWKEFLKSNDYYRVN